MTSPLRDEPQQWVRVPVKLTNAMSNATVNAWHSWKSRDNGGNIQQLGGLVWEHLLDAAPKDSKHIERAMELALDCESWRLARLTGTTQDHRNYTTKKLDEARAALRRHLEGGGSE